MPADRPSNRKATSQRPSASNSPSAKKKPAKSRTVDNLEALLHLLDDDAGSAAKPASQTVGAARPPRTKSAKLNAEGSSFMRELARARDEIHKEHRSRLALEEEVESLRRELRDAAKCESSQVEDLRKESESLRRQITALEKQLKKLHTSRFELESQLEAEQQWREKLIDEVDAISARLHTAQLQRDRTATQLENASRQCESLKSELDALQLGSVSQQSEIADLTLRIANDEVIIGEQNELLEQARASAVELEETANSSQARLQEERESRARFERELSEHAINSNAAQTALEASIESLRQDNTSLRERQASAQSELEAELIARTRSEGLLHALQQEHQESLAKHEQLALESLKGCEELAATIQSLEDRLSNAQQKVAEFTAAEQQLRSELTDERHERHKATLTLDETVAMRDRLERRIAELEQELFGNNRRLEQGRDATEAIQDRIGRLESDVAKARMELAASCEQLGVARLRQANSERDRDHAQQREAEAVRRVEELADEVKTLQASVQREAAARRKAEAVQKRESSDNDVAALFEAEQKIDRLSRELTASKSVEAAYQQKAARKVQQAQQEIEALRQRLAEYVRGTGAP